MRSITILNVCVRVHSSSFFSFFGLRAQGFAPSLRWLSSICFGRRLNTVFGHKTRCFRLVAAELSWVFNVHTKADGKICCFFHSLMAFSRICAAIWMLLDADAHDLTISRVRPWRGRWEWFRKESEWKSWGTYRNRSICCGIAWIEWVEFKELMKLY